MTRAELDVSTPPFPLSRDWAQALVTAAKILKRRQRRGNPDDVLGVALATSIVAQLLQLEGPAGPELVQAFSDLRASLEGAGTLHQDGAQ
jgi:hypothetical protein